MDGKLTLSFGDNRDPCCPVVDMDDRALYVIPEDPIDWLIEPDNKVGPGEAEQLLGPFDWLGTWDGKKEGYDQIYVQARDTSSLPDDRNDEFLKFLNLVNQLGYEIVVVGG